MNGSVQDGEAQIKLVVRGPSGRKLQIKAVVDTGSDGYLTLPRSVIEALELPRTASIRARLADGSEATFQVYRTKVLWHRRIIDVDVESAETLPLVGLSLLAGCELKMQVLPGGNVSIKPLK